MAQFTTQLQLRELYWKEPSLQFWTAMPINTQEENLVFEIFDPIAGAHKFVSLSRSEYSKQLGSILEHDACCEKAMDARRRAATNAFWADKVIRTRDLSIRERFARYCEQIQPVMLWACESFVWTSGALRRFHQLEGGLLRRMLGLAKKPRETMENFMRRGCRSARKLFINQGFRTVDEIIADRLHSYAGLLTGVGPGDDPAESSVQRQFCQDALLHLPDYKWRETKEHMVREKAKRVRDEHTTYRWVSADPVQWQHHPGYKRCAQWEDCFISVFGLKWRNKVDLKWSEHRNHFIYKLLENWNLGGEALHKQRKKAIEKKRDFKAGKRKARPWIEPSCVFGPAPLCDLPPYSFLIDIAGDNSAVVGWINGEQQCKSIPFQRLVANSQDQLHGLWPSGHVYPAMKGTNWLRHVLREGNTLADEVCRECIARQTNVVQLKPWEPEQIQSNPVLLRCSFDGGQRGPHSAAGFVLQTMVTVSPGTEPTMVTWIRYGVYKAHASSTSMEIMAASLLIRQLFEITKHTSLNDLCAALIDNFPDSGPPAADIEARILESTRPKRRKR